jgi:hypothetical protein
LSGVQSVGQFGSAPDVRASIARAAEATGVDFNYLLAQAKLESELNPNARARTSSAAGLYQFLGGTWLDTVDKHAERHGLDWAGSAIRDGANGKVVDPAMRSAVMALRFDPDASSLMAAELANDNRALLTETLGREPDHAELYLAHFLGGDGASRFLQAMGRDPGASAAEMFPKAAAANHNVFFGSSGPRSLSGVMEHFRRRMDEAGAAGTSFPPTAMPAVGTSPQGPPQPPLGPLASEFRTFSQSYPARNRASMVDTLQQTFAVGGQGAMPGNVKAAYAKLKALGL